MRAMIDGRIYDTETSEKLARFTRQVDRGPLFGGEGSRWTPRHEFTLYRTAWGGFFELDEVDETIVALTRRAVRALMRELDLDAGPLEFGA